MLNQYSKPTTPHQLSTGNKPSLSNLHVLFCTCVVQNSTTHTDTKALNMRHHSQKCFWGIFLGISKHQKVYLVYVPSTQKIVSSRDVALDETFSSALGYLSCTYSEALATLPAVSYILYAASSHKQTGNIINF